MRTVTKEYQLFTYGELSDEAKEKVKQWLLDARESFIFTEDIVYELEDQFKNSDLKVQYDLGYCQGDGLNIYGVLNLYDALENVKDNLTAKEYKTVKHYIDNSTCNYQLPYNDRYCYCVARYIDIDEEVLDYFDDYRNLKYDVMKKFNNLIKEMFEKLCDKYEKQGYDYFYEITDEEAEEYCDCNEYEFLENGEFYF